MKAEIKAKWIEALRSGEYKQTTNALRDAAGYCCLGVLCDLHAKETGTQWRGLDDPYTSYEYLKVNATLPDEVVAWAGVDGATPFVEINNHPITLARWNDEEHPFSEIADLIEEQL